MKIVTLTLNPAFDIHCLADGFVPYGESFVEVSSRDAGGKGVNISRALRMAGTGSLAVVVLGEDNGEEFYKMLVCDGISVYPIYTRGRIRENITLHEKEKPETRISFGGISAGRELLSDVGRAIGEVGENTVITFTGSIPRGIEAADLLELLRAYGEQGAKIVIDSRSVTLSEIIEFKPWLIKPNRDEAEKYTGKSIDTPLEAARIAADICKAGVENVMISLGADGAVLATPGGAYHCAPPNIDVLSTIGAGDSSVAGFIDGTQRGYCAEACLCRAVAFGTAACLCEGTKAPRASDVDKIEKRISVVRLSV